MYAATRLKRDVVIALLVLVALWQLPSALFPEPTTHWGKLERWMNRDGASGSRPARLHYVKSSVDWGQVEFRHPPRSQAQVPLSLSLSLPSHQTPKFRVQYPFEPEGPDDARTRLGRLMEVRKLFQANWDSYRRFAWKRDALLPISGGGRDQFSGWAATLVDSLDTLWIMGLRHEFEEALQAVAEIDFGHSTSPRVNMFETNIRYLGGLMSAYDLSRRDVLLQKAVELGDLIYAGFNTPNGMPVDFIDFEAAKTGQGLEVEDRVVSASPGTLSLELAHLSQLTGDDKYHSAMDSVMDLFYRGQNKTELPGAWPMWVSMKNEDVTTGAAFTLGGCQDSLFEYLPKMHQLLRGTDPKYEIMTKTFLETAEKHFLFRPMLPKGEGDSILMPGNINIVDNKPVLDPETEHLACFVGGMFGLAGQVLDRREYVDTGIKATNGCVYAYRAFPTGMMPERVDMVPCMDPAHCPWDEEYWVKERNRRPEWKEHLPKGFTTAKDPRYILRPEAIESVFYLYRITGKKEFQDAAWDMFTAISNGTRTEYANAAVLDVTVGQYPLPKDDYMESFWLAETLKYFYLVFSTPDVINLDDFVLNTEAHPFKVPV